MPEKINPEIGPAGWDKEAIYDGEISPLMNQIIAICHREKIPMLASFVYRESDDTGDGESGLCITHLPGPKFQFNPKLSEACAKIRSGGAHAFALTITSPK